MVSTPLTVRDLAAVVNTPLLVGYLRTVHTVERIFGVERTDRQGSDTVKRKGADF